MIVRQGLNFAAHFVVGVAFGVLAVVALRACRQRNQDDWDGDRADDVVGEVPFTVEPEVASGDPA